MVRLPFATMLKGRVTGPMENVGGSTVMVLTLIVAVPVLEMTMFCAVLEVPTVWLGKLKVFVLRLTMALLVAPVPVTGMARLLVPLRSACRCN